MAKPTRTPAPPQVAAAQTELPKNFRLTRLYLGAACFLAGASMMVIEICAYRLLAPLFGNSVYTWTALIGVVLIAFSAGGFIGGRLADRRAGLEVLGWLLTGASLLTFAVPPLHAWFGNGFLAGGFIWGSTLLSLFLFAVPGAMLGAVSPAAVRFYSLTLSDTHVGAAAGTISMLGSLGSFVGTFLSGFVLLAHFGVRFIFIGTAALLLLLGLAAFALDRKAVSRQVGLIVAAALFGTLAAFSKPQRDSPGVVLFEKESYYHHIEVSETGEKPDRKRLLRLDSTNEGGMNPDTGALVFPYQEFWRLVQLKDGLKMDKALFIGAGAFGMPEDLSRQFPQAAVDVAEIDPEVIEVGRQFFNLNQYPRVQAHAGDARHFLRTRPEERWDLIFGDAYNGVHAIPAHLLSREFFELVEQRLTPEGVFIINSITAIQGTKSHLLGGIIATLKAVFPYVEAFDVQSMDGLTYSKQGVRNVILLASHQDWLPLIKDKYHAPGSLQKKLAATRIPPEQLPRQGMVFTDDFNPVEAIIARSLVE
jgi:spermidine synthase